MPNTRASPRVNATAAASSNDTAAAASQPPVTLANINQDLIRWKTLTQPPSYEEALSWTGRTIQFINPDGTVDSEHYHISEYLPSNNSIHALVPIQRPTPYPRFVSLYTKDFVFVDAANRPLGNPMAVVVSPSPAAATAMPTLQAASRASSPDPPAAGRIRKTNRKRKAQASAVPIRQRKPPTAAAAASAVRTRKPPPAAAAARACAAPVRKKKPTKVSELLLAAQRDAVGRQVKVLIDNSFAHGTIVKFIKKTGKHTIRFSHTNRIRQFDLQHPDLKWVYTDYVPGKSGQNSGNHSISSSRFMGVSRKGLDRFVCFSKNYFVGTFASEEDAALAYDVHIRQVRPQSPVNFPNKQITREEMYRRMVQLNYEGVEESKSKQSKHIVYFAKYGAKRLGAFATPQQAAMAHDVEARRRKSCKKLNFPRRTIDPALVELLKSRLDCKPSSHTSPAAHPFPKYPTGTKVLKDFGFGEGVYMGEVLNVNMESQWYAVFYEEDGDEEELEEYELDDLDTLPPENKNTKPPPSTPPTQVPVHGLTSPVKAYPPSYEPDDDVAVLV